MLKRRLISALFLTLWTLVAFAPASAGTNSPTTHSQKQANKAAKNYSKQQAKAQKKQIKQQQKAQKKWNKQHPRVTTT